MRKIVCLHSRMHVCWEVFEFCDNEKQSSASCDAILMPYMSSGTKSQSVTTVLLH